MSDRKMEVKVKTVLSKIALIIFISLFSLISIKGILWDNFHNISYVFVSLFALAWLALYGVIFWLTKRFSQFFERYYWYILIIATVLYMALQFFISYWLKFFPIYDMGSVYGGAVQWLTTGSFSDHYEYFGTFPNNLGALTLLRFAFGIAAKFGIEDFLVVGATVNIFLVVATLVITSLTAKKMFGKLAGVRAIFVFLSFVPFYFIGAVFYTDSLSLLFPILVYYLYLNFKDQKKWQWKIIIALLAGIFLAAGFLIKGSAAIVLIAIAIDGLLNVNWKNVIVFLLISMAILIGANAGFKSYIYNRHLSDSHYQNLITPVWHWFMMGLSENGYCNMEDYSYTRAFPVEERSSACISLIKTRVHELGPKGLLNLWSNKITICFLDGTCALSDFLDDYPKYDTWLHKYILYDGEKYRDYQNMANGALIALYLLMIINAFVLLLKKRNTDSEEMKMTPLLSGIGIVLFLMLWETSGRYFINFIPMFFICAIIGLSGNRRQENGQD